MYRSWLLLAAGGIESQSHWARSSVRVKVRFSKDGNALGLLLPMVGKSQIKSYIKVKGKVFSYSLPSVGPGAEPGVQAVSPQVTWSESRHRPVSRLPLLSAKNPRQKSYIPGGKSPGVFLKSSLSCPFRNLRKYQSHKIADFSALMCTVAGWAFLVAFIAVSHAIWLQPLPLPTYRQRLKTKTFLFLNSFSDITLDNS